MSRKCFMCGREISTGILCEKCDKPRKQKADGAGQTAAPIETAPEAIINAPTQHAHALDPFPKAPVVPFPVENVSLAMTSVVDLLIASGVAAILLGPDKSVRFVSEQAKSLFDVDVTNVRVIEEKTGIRIGELSVRTSSGLQLGDQNFAYSLVPMSGGSSGAVLVFRPTGMFEDAPLLEAPPEPSINDVIRVVADRFTPFADSKNVHVQVDVPEIDASFADHERLAESLAILMDNALHYVPEGGQVVIGVRSMEHKGKPLLLFFVMDNGALVPESLRQVIFEPSFVWNPSGVERTGRGLFKTREFAISHSGSVWCESKTGKACTFFLRVRPDGVDAGAGSPSTGDVF